MIYIFGKRVVMPDLWREEGYLSPEGNSKERTNKSPCVCEACGKGEVDL